jgi:hypothetical protein
VSSRGAVQDFGKLLKTNKKMHKVLRKKAVFAKEEEFDAVLSQLLKMKPIPMKKLKTSGQKGPKGPLIRRKP